MLFPFQQAKSYGRYSGQIIHQKSSTESNLACLNMLDEHHESPWCWKNSHLNVTSRAAGLKCNVKHEDSWMNKTTDATSPWLNGWGVSNSSWKFVFLLRYRSLYYFSVMDWLFLILHAPHSECLDSSLFWAALAPLHRIFHWECNWHKKWSARG